MSEKSYIPSGVFLVCDKGILPTPLTVTSALTVDFLGANVATDLDKVPGVNIKPFGVCALTHGPCTYMPQPLAWTGVQEDVVIQGGSPLLEDSQLHCVTGGCISVSLSLSAAMLRLLGNANDALNAVVDGAIKTVEDSIGSGFDTADDYLKKLPPPFQNYAREELGKAQGTVEGVTGIVTGIWGLVKLGNSLQLKAANAVSYAIDHPAEAGAAIEQGMQRGWTAAQDKDNWLKAADVASYAVPGVAQARVGLWLQDPAHQALVAKVTKAAYAKASAYMADPRQRGRVEGRLAFEVAFALATVGVGEAANAGKISEAANVLEKGGETLKALEATEGAVESGRVVTGAKEAAQVAEREGLAVAEKPAAEALEAKPGANKSQEFCEKDPIDVATGAMLSDAIDIELPGPVPFVWERTWYSTSDRQGPLGHGWHHSYDLALWQDAAGRWFMRLADGHLGSFGPLTAANNFRALLRGEQLELSLDPDQAGHYRVLSRREQLTYHFALAPAAGFWHLKAVRNAQGQGLRFAYSPAGHLCGITDSAERPVGVRTDAAGRILALDLPHADGSPGTFAAVQYAYDEAGNLAAVTDAEGHVLRMAYQDHLLTTKTFRTGASFYFAYDARRRCTRTWGDENYLNGRFFYEEGHTVLLTDEPAARQEYWHAQGLVTRYLDPVGGLHEWHYNAHRELELARDPLGQTTLYDYDGQGRLLTTTRPDGTRTQVSYTPQGQLTEATDANDGRWQWAYNAAGQLTERRDPTGATTTYGYDALGRLAALTDALGQPTRLGYDAQHNLAHVVAADGSIRSRAYDALGRLTHLTDARGQVQQRRYDRLGQLVALREPTGLEQRFTYDGQGNLTRAEEGSQVVDMTYTPLDQLAHRRQGGQQTAFAYDREGRLTQLTNARGEAYRFGLDAAGQVAEEVGFDGLTRRYERDLAGRVTQLSRPAGRSTAYVYDAAGRVAEVVHNGSERTAYRYRADGALLEATTADSVVSFERDARGRVLAETQNGHTVSSTYNLGGQRLALSSSLGAHVRFERDALGQVRRTQAGAWQSVVGRDADGLELHRQLSGGVRLDWQHDAAGRPTSQRISAGGQPVRQRRYQWQGADQLAAIEDSATGTTQFTYDALGALTGATYADGPADVRQPDAVGNLFRTKERTDRRYGKGGQLQQAGGTRYKYDEEGNLTRKTLVDGQAWHYAWDGAGQLVEVKRPDGYAVTFTYDGLGRRVSKRFRGKVTRWVWDGDQPLHEWHELEVGPGAGSVGELTTWLFEDDSFAPLAKLTAKGAQSVVCDHLGTPLGLYDEQGGLTWEMALDSYGAVRQGKGKSQDCPFRYQGQYEDTETGLYYNNFRYYDPEMGYYISQDPIGLLGGTKLYSYVRDPNSVIDPWGLMPWEPGTPKPKGWRLPKNGTWSGAPGHSDFIPNNPAALGLKKGNVIPFIKGSPDLSAYSVKNLEVPGMTGVHRTDMPLIHDAVAKEYGLPNQTAGKNMLSTERITPHHAGGNTVNLVPTDLHDGVRHTGGASDLRATVCPKN